MKKAVLYVCAGRSFFRSAPGRKIGEVVRCWGDAGHDVHHLCGGDILPEGQTSGGAKAPHLYGAQKTYTRWYRRVPGADPLVHSLSEWRDIRHDRQMRTHLRKKYSWHPVRLVWERSSRLHDAGMRFARQIRVPYVLEWKDHLVDYDRSLFRGRALKLEVRKNAEADFIVVESGVLKDGLAREGVDPGKIIVAHNAVDVTQFSRAEAARARVRAELGISDDAVLAGYLGSFAFYHDAPRLVRAAALIAGRQGKRPVKVLMVGAGKEYSQSRALADQLGVLDDTLLMLPGVPKDQVPELLSALDIAVLPGSTDIICPIKVQEYMASELPTVAPDYACNREVLEDGVTGSLFKPKDEADLAAKIIELAGDPAGRMSIGKQAREVVAKCFTWQATWVRALDEILAASGS